ncbi:MAG: hypothetical protein Q9175_000995 [Cornicularia normoerica]
MAAAMPQTPSSGGQRTRQSEWQLDLPHIDQDEPFGELPYLAHLTGGTRPHVNTLCFEKIFPQE